MPLSRKWTLNQMVVLTLIAGFVMLLFDIRSEHVDVVHDKWQAWIPIYYAAAMIVVGTVGMAAWRSWGRVLLMVGFVAAFVVGGLGYYFHTGGHLITGVATILHAWSGNAHRDDGPPALAPLAFGGLGLLGVVACLRAYQPRP